MPLLAVALLCPRLALPSRCCASPSHIGAVPRNAAASLIVAVRCCAIASPCIPCRCAPFLRYAVASQRVAVLSPCHATPTPPCHCVASRCQSVADVAVQSRRTPEPCCAIALQPSALALLGQPMRAPRYRLPHVVEDYLAVVRPRDAAHERAVPSVAPLAHAAKLTVREPLD